MKGWGMGWSGSIASRTRAAAKPVARTAAALLRANFANHRSTAANPRLPASGQQSAVVAARHANPASSTSIVTIRQAKLLHFAIQGCPLSSTGDVVACQPIPRVNAGEHFGSSSVQTQAADVILRASGHDQPASRSVLSPVPRRDPLFVPLPLAIPANAAPQHLGVGTVVFPANPFGCRSQRRLLRAAGSCGVLVRLTRQAKAAGSRRGVRGGNAGIVCRGTGAACDSRTVWKSHGSGLQQPGHTGRGDSGVWDHQGGAESEVIRISFPETLAGGSLAGLAGVPVPSPIRPRDRSDA